MAPIVFYTLAPSPPCRAALITIKLLGIDVTLKDVDILEKRENLEPWFLKMNACHSIPTMDDNGFYLWESRAIMTYLVQKYGKNDSLYPKELKLRATVDKMLFFDVDKLYSAIRAYFRKLMREKKLPGEAERQEIKNNMAILEATLKQSPYVAGTHLTIADISLLVSVTTLEGLDEEYATQFPAVYAWVQKLKKEITIYDEVNQPGLDAFTDYMRNLRTQIERA